MIRQELNPENANQSRSLDTKGTHEVLLESDEEYPKKCRYVWMANPDIPLCDLASLNWVSHRVPSSPAL